MRVAIFSDVHGNLDALQEVLEKITELQVDRVICLGDVVGYGADPNACVDLVQDVADVGVAGNHDWASVGLLNTQFFNPIPLIAIQWTADVLDERQANFLRRCPLVLNEDPVFYVHASPHEPERWHYLSDLEDGRAALHQTTSQLCFVGHSHRAFICSESNQTDVIIEGHVQLCVSDRYLINVGSVGQPRDGDPRASFAIWDQGSGNLHLHRVSYDVLAAQKKIREARLPEFLAERLAVGR
ncbi:MAG: metallophosphoesterase family protein [Candidatus Latescibacteria bacterium]|mgnify:CR=1 FL=1|nr:metallophosphoesterase family protein [Candidatus Latescibacterota bacterium]